MAAVLWLAGLAAPESSGAEIDLGRIETEESRAETARYEEKLDPAKDGWNSEAFSDLARGQLGKLKALLSNPEKLTGTTLSEVVDLDRVSLQPLRPETQLAEAYRTSGLLVRRLLPAGTPALKEDALPEFKKLAGAFESPQIKFKLFQVALLPGGKAETRQFFAISDHVREENSTWKITWNLTDAKIERIEIEAFEQVSRLEQGTLFHDATGSILGDDPALRDHLGHGINYWQGRIEKILSMHYFGHNGIAVGDVNGDGLDDLYACQAAAVPNKLLLQQPDGTTIDTAEVAGVDLLNASRAPLLVDLDNDGDQDLAVTTPYAVLVFANDGKGSFKLAQHLDGAGGGYSLTATDYDNDGDLDLYVCVYYRKPGDARALAYPIPYHDANNGGQNILLRNDGALSFSDVTKETGMLAENHRFSFAASWEDFDGDGDQDLYVANDYGRNNLYRNQLIESGIATFMSDAAVAGIEDTSFGMSVCWGDANGDGKIDLYTGNMFSGAGNRIAYQDRFQQHAPGEIKAKLQRTARGNSLFLNNGDATFRDVTMTSGARQGRWAWGSIFSDINNDGLEDLVVGNGFVTGKREDDL
ncbi:MAG: VCBS repeat-containing protein [Akkermansiaceae bacterium]